MSVGLVRGDKLSVDGPFVEAMPRRRAASHENS
jgi:hypothetical protein